MGAKSVTVAGGALFARYAGCTNVGSGVPIPTYGGIKLDTTKKHFPGIQQEFPIPQLPTLIPAPSVIPTLDSSWELEDPPPECLTVRFVLAKPGEESTWPLPPTGPPDPKSDKGVCRVKIQYVCVELQGRVHGYSAAAGPWP